MRQELASVLDLQAEWVPKGDSDAMRLRGLYIRDDIASFIRARRAHVAERLGVGVEDVEIEGKDAIGSFSRVPWVRFANRNYSPSPREGWYGVYLFAEDGASVALSLNQGTQIWDGLGIRSQPV